MNKLSCKLRPELQTHLSPQELAFAVRSVENNASLFQVLICMLYKE